MGAAPPERQYLLRSLGHGLIVAEVAPRQNLDAMSDGQVARLAEETVAGLANAGFRPLYSVTPDPSDPHRAFLVTDGPAPCPLEVVTDEDRDALRALLRSGVTDDLRARASLLGID